MSGFLNNEKGFFGGGSGFIGGSSSPFPIVGLVAWFKADTGVTKTGTAVTGWLDQSGNHNDLTGTATYVASGLNGLPILTFDGASNALRTVSGLSNTGDFTVFMFVRQNSAPAYCWTFSYSGSAFGQVSGILNNGASNDLMINRVSNNSNIANGPANTSPPWHTLSMVQRSAGTESIWTDNTVTNSSVGGDNTSCDNISIGGQLTQDTFISNFTEIDVAEVIFFNENVESIRVTVESYLLAKWTPIPTVSSISKSVVDFSGGSSVIITGINLYSTKSVKFGGTNAASFVINSDSQITAVTPAKTASATPVDVTVTNGSNQPGTLVSAIEFFSPLNLTNTFMWMRADLGYTNANTNTWIDQKNGKVFDTTVGYFASSGTQPTQVSGLNGKTALSFTGNKCIGNATPLNTNGQHEFLIFKADGSGGQNTVRDFGDATAGIDPFYTLDGVKEILDCWNSNVRGDYQSDINADNKLTAGCAIEVTNDGSNQTYFLNGTTCGTSAGTLATTGTPTYGRSRDALATNGAISEDIVLSSIATTGERNRIKAYLLDRYGITIS